MRFRPANISLINRRHYLPRLLRLIAALGQDVVIEIRPRGEKKGAGRVRVVGAG